MRIGIIFFYLLRIGIGFLEDWESEPESFLYFSRIEIGIRTVLLVFKNDSNQESESESFFSFFQTIPNDSTVYMQKMVSLTSMVFDSNFPVNWNEQKCFCDNQIPKNWETETQKEVQTTKKNLFRLLFSDCINVVHGKLFADSHDL